MSAIIEVKGVTKRFGGFRAVNDCSLSVERGSVTGLIGPNGAGKSTLFNMVAGNFPPTSGAILLDGQDVTGLPAHVLFHRHLLRTFQIAHEFSNMTVLENLMMVPDGQTGEGLGGAWFLPGRVARQESEIRRKAEEVLDFLKITHVKHELAGNLSGGQKKLLELGRTMMADAKVVLLDEIAAGVNRTLLNDLASNIERLNREMGYTFFVIEHDMDLIARLCDPVIVMAAGSVMTKGHIEDIQKDPAVIEAYFGGSPTGNATSYHVEDEEARA
ncbi:ABC transporter ATP-binding protein [Pararhizobium haloflavum]|uniref:ABC transporter ATP-binding protein n=1 Tax=Pararhizobium haloflavum TaxID=2037914 RepID=UPI000C181738|nr:ABC transporter ATP-binding protein [Pararhizobium haloflavum]